MKKSIKICALALVLALFALSASGCAALTPPSSDGGGAQTAKRIDISQTACFESRVLTFAELRGAGGITRDLSVEPQTVLKRDGVAVSVAGIDMQGDYNLGLELNVENGSGKTLMLHVHSSSVNGYAVFAYIDGHVEIAPGETKKVDIRFHVHDLEIAGINNVAEIEFRLRLIDKDNYEHLFNSDVIRIRTSAFDGSEFCYDDLGETVWSEDGVAVSVAGILDDEEHTGLLFGVVNDSGKDVLVSVQEAYINGKKADALASCTVCSGRRAIDTVRFSGKNAPMIDLDHGDPSRIALDVGRVETITLSFEICELDEGGYFSENSSESELMTFKFN